MLQQFKKLVNNLKVKLLNSILRGVVTDNKGSILTDYPTLQVNIMGRVGDIEVLFPYGITATAPIDSIVTTFSIGANAADRSGIAYDPTTRIKGLEEGEVAVGNFLIGTYLKFTKLGKIMIFMNNIIVVPDLVANLTTHTHISAIPGNPTGPPVTPPTP